jgi:hypothetical protein
MYRRPAPGYIQLSGYIQRYIYKKRAVMFYKSREFAHLAQSCIRLKDGGGHTQPHQIDERKRKMTKETELRVLSDAELDHVHGGHCDAFFTQNPNDLCNGTNKNSNGASGAPGNSFHPGH